MSFTDSGNVFVVEVVTEVEYRWDLIFTVSRYLEGFVPFLFRRVPTVCRGKDFQVESPHGL